MRSCRPLAAALLLLAVTPAPAQAQDLDASVELSSDHRRRGLSWSDGAAALSGSLSAAVADNFRLSVSGTSLRGSRRHGGADVGLDLSGAYSADLGPARLSAGVVGHVFTGKVGLNYVELEGRISQALGPVQGNIGAIYAPAQDAIGGSNLYLSAGVDLGVPATPMTFYAQVGRSSGTVDQADRALRLRPQNRYWDYMIGVDYIIGPISAGLRYADSSIHETRLPAAPFVDVHVGGRLVGSIRFGF